jgi:hypothetical protein
MKLPLTTIDRNVDRGAVTRLEQFRAVLHDVASGSQAPAQDAPPPMDSGVRLGGGRAPRRPRAA